MYKINRYSLILVIPALLAFNRLSADSGQAAPAKLRVTAEQANIRSEPDIGSRILMQAPAPAVFSVIEKSGEWFHIRYVMETGESLTGYVHESLVAMVPAEPEAKPREIETRKPDVIKPKIAPRPEPVKKPDPLPPPDPAPIRFSEMPDPVQAPLRAPFPGSRGDFSLAGGGVIAAGGDINQGSQGIADYYHDLLQTSRRGKGLPLHFAWRFGGEMRYYLGQRLAVGAGISFLSGGRESDMSFTSGESLNIQPEIRAVPFRIFATYSLKPGLYAKAGIEYIFAECAYRYRFQQDEIWQEWQGQAQAHGPGLLGGLGYTHPLTERLDLFVELLGRVSRISGFKGEDMYRDWEGREVEEEGTLYLYSVQTAGDSTHKLLFIRDRVPTEAGVTEATEARLNLSGVSIRLGLRIRF